MSTTTTTSHNVFVTYKFQSGDEIKMQTWLQSPKNAMRWALDQGEKLDAELINSNNQIVSFTVEFKFIKLIPTL